MNRISILFSLVIVCTLSSTLHGASKTHTPASSSGSSSSLSSTTTAEKIKIDADTAQRLAVATAHQALCQAYYNARINKKDPRTDSSVLETAKIHSTLHDELETKSRLVVPTTTAVTAPTPA